MGALSKARSGQVQKHQTPQDYVEGLLSQVGRAIEQSAPRGFDVERLKGQFVHACVTAPDLLRCDATSLQVAVVDVATQGLELGEEVFLIPRKGRAVVQMGYKGTLAKVYRSPQVKAVRTGVYRENDARCVVDKGAGTVEHHPCMSGDPGQTLGYWARIDLVNDSSICEYMTRDEVEQHRRQYRADGPAWKTSYDAMAQKTVLIQCMRTAPKSRELSDALAVEYQRDRPSLRALGAGHLAESFTPEAEVVADGPLMVPFGPDEGTPVSEVSTEGLNWLGEQLFEKIKTSKGKEREQQQMLSEAVSAELSRRGQ